MAVAILGAGPSGLYLAAKLWKAGVKDIVLIDPRANEYVRPGHILNTVFEKAEKGVGQKLRSNTNTAHIKDLERALYKYVESSGISIQRGTFLRFSEEKKGIIITLETGEEKFIACEYAFDCTGAKRALVHAVNARVKPEDPKPFEIVPVTKDVTVKNHLLAYVKMNSLEMTEVNYIDHAGFKLGSKTSLDFAHAMEAFRKLGWREMGYPRCYGMEFGKSKICLYLEAPDNLPENKKAEWLQAVLAYETENPDISFQFVKDSQKYKYKPRFTTFEIDPKQLKQFCYQKTGLPCVITQGDTQIDPNYFLAHGIEDSFERIDKTISCLLIDDGKIIYFDKETFEKQMVKSLIKHRNALIEHYEERQEYFLGWLLNSRLYYEKAIKVTLNPETRVLFKTRLAEICARLAYHDAVDIIDKLKGFNGGISFTSYPPAEVMAQLVKARKLFEQANRELPPMFKNEQEDTKLQLARLAGYFKEFGNHLYSQAAFVKALEAYQHVIDISKMGFVDMQTLISLYSSMIFTHRKLNQPLVAIRMACKILGEKEVNEMMRKKILFNAICAAIDAIEGMDGNNIKDVCREIEQLQELCSRNEDFIEEPLQVEFSKGLEKVKYFLRDLAKQFLERGDFAAAAEYNEKVLMIANKETKKSQITSVAGAVDDLIASGKTHLASGKFALALVAYEDALLMHRSSTKSNDRELEGNLVAEIVCIYRKLNRTVEAFPVAIPLLELALSTDIKKKILFTLIKGAAEVIKSTSNPPQNISKQIEKLCLKHGDFIEQNLEKSLRAELECITASITSENNKAPKPLF
ncbi:hypothetical protein [Legionella cardiaca]|uniref:4-hydroxybenzoate 3-monooxygenase n=1 Tax=Legionella cardiaca TaxID=1071983 RepID=A0ABY8AY72_9GAMM|nr:hypothetical protein [Legionella cardiaca]WED44455.1 hypothetical protein PXX05_06635 [Legionella cardiaca]